MATQPQTLETILRRLRPLFPPVLIDGLGWKHLLDLAADLPAEGAKHMGFEFRLNDPVPAADFCLAVQPDNTEVAQHFIRRGRAAQPGSAAAALAWLITQLGEAGSTLSLWANLAGLEYDLADFLHNPPEHRSEPGVFLRLRRHPKHPMRMTTTRVRWHANIWRIRLRRPLGGLKIHRSAARSSACSMRCHLGRY